MTLQLFPTEFPYIPYIWRKFYFIFYQCTKVPFKADMKVVPHTKRGQGCWAELPVTSLDTWCSPQLGSTSGGQGGRSVIGWSLGGRVVIGWEVGGLRVNGKAGDCRAVSGTQTVLGQQVSLSPVGSALVTANTSKPSSQVRASHTWTWQTVSAFSEILEYVQAWKMVITFLLIPTVSKTYCNLSIGNSLAVFFSKLLFHFLVSEGLIKLCLLKLSPEHVQLVQLSTLHVSPILWAVPALPVHWEQTVQQPPGSVRRCSGGQDGEMGGQAVVSCFRDTWRTKMVL